MITANSLKAKMFYILDNYSNEINLQKLLT